MYIKFLSGRGSRKRSQGPCDQFLLDFVGTAVDALSARICVQPADGELGHVAVATVQLQALVNDLALDIRQPPLAHRRSRQVKAAGEMSGHAVIEEHTRDLGKGGA